MVGGHWLLSIIDSYSKWVDVHVTISASATVPFDRLRQTFAAQGLPIVVVTGNAPPSRLLRTLMKTIA